MCLWLTIRTLLLGKLHALWVSPLWHSDKESWAFRPNLLLEAAFSPGPKEIWNNPRADTIHSTIVSPFAFPRVHFRTSCAQQNGDMFLPGLLASLGGPWLRWHDGGISASGVPGKLLSSCPSQTFAFPGFLWNFGAHLECVSWGYCGKTWKLNHDCSH